MSNQKVPLEIPEDLQFLYDGCKRSEYSASRTMQELIERIALQAQELQQLREELMDWENREAAVCPEDVGFEELIKVLKARVAGEAMTAEQELKPCPFCGSSATICSADANHVFDGMFYVSCDKCFCVVGEGYDASAMPDHQFYEREAAITAWNTRLAPEPSKEPTE